MSDQNGDRLHTPAAKLPKGRPFATGHDPRRNPGGRPLGLAKLAREVVGDGEDLVRFFTAVLHADRKFLGERRVALRDRMVAATWLADRAFGRAVQVVEIPEDPQQEQVQEVREELRAMPVELREAVGRWLLERRNSRLRAEREAIEARVKSMLPPAQPLNPGEDGAS